jgi:hypothetical protein
MGLHTLHAVVDGPVYQVELTGGAGSTVCVPACGWGTPVPTSN